MLYMILDNLKSVNDAWTSLTKSMSKTYEVDLDKVLESLTDPDLDSAASECMDPIVEDITAAYIQTLEGDADDLMEPYHPAIPIMILDAGYDVWIDGNRGTTYQRGNVDLDWEEDDEFWDYSYKEMGSEDQPA